MSNRYRVLPEGKQAREAWRLRSSLVLDEYVDAHEETLAAFGLDSPLALDDIRAYLRSERTRARGLTVSTDVKQRARAVTYPTSRGLGGMFFPSDYEPVRVLMHNAEFMAGWLDCPIQDAVGFMLTGKAFDLPWIDVERWHVGGLTEDGEPVGVLGVRFIVHVGHGDATAEDVRAAYNAGRKHFLGSDQPRALPDHVVALVVMDGQGRSRGLTWGERHERWLEYAEEWQLRGRDGRLKYPTRASYMNYIKKLARQHEWIRFELTEGVDDGPE